MQLNFEDGRHLSAAEGYVELGLAIDANNELESVSAEMRHVPQVLAVRTRIYLKLEKWELLQVVAKQLAAADADEPKWPLLWAYAIRRTDCLEAAREILIEATKRHPKSALLQYNLACYHCQLGDLLAAKLSITDAFRLNPNLRLAALDDPDLKPLWDLSS